MTAFLTIDVLRAQTAPTREREAVRRVDGARSKGQLIRPFRRWRTGNKVPELPPG